MIRQLQNQRDIAAVRDDDPNFAGTLAKGLMILQSFLRDPRPRANSELAAALGLSRPTVSRLCRTLVDLGYLDRDERIDRYFIGPMAVALSYPYIVSVPMRAQARTAMQQRWKGWSASALNRWSAARRASTSRSPPGHSAALPPTSGGILVCARQTCCK